MIHLTIDHLPVEVEEGTTILQAARKLGISIPTLCHMEGLFPDGSCRICIVEVANAGRTQLVASCSMPCREGDVILTRSQAVIHSRRKILDLLLSNHRVHCFSCPANGDCRLQDLCYEYGVSETSFSGQTTPAEIDDSNPFFTYDPSLCILCHRCVNTCTQIVGRGAIHTMNRGFDSRIGGPAELNWSQGICESCGNCVQACPTGALSMKFRKRFRASQIDRKVRTTCPHCGAGCQMELLFHDGKVVGAQGADGPSNHGLLCVKGRCGSFDFLHSGDRLTDPLIKDRATGKFRKASWDEAMDLVASKFTQIKQTYGPDALAGFACSRSANEDIYMLQKLVRTAFGTNNTDNCARVCHAPTVAGLATTLGSGAMTNTIEDITRDCDAILLVGSNAEEAHPVLGMQLRAAVRRGAKLIVVDPRDIDLAKQADIHLKLRPGTNVAFANGMLHVIFEENLQDEAFIRSRTEVDQYERLRKLVEPYTPEKVAEICRIDPDDLRAAARMYAKADAAPIIYCLGVTEHSTGTEGVMSLSNLAMVTGKLGRPGCGVNPIRGQNNVQGGCDMGALPTDFPGYQKVLDPAVVAKFEQAWGVPLSPNPGLKATDCFPAMLEGTIKGLFIFGEDPMRTDPDTHHVQRALQALDFLVVDDLFLTETAKMADVVLPGRAYAEKEGTFTNTERRVQRIRKAVEGPGNSRLDTDIFTDLMNRMGYPQPYLTAAEIMDEAASLIPSFAGISHARLDSDEIGGQGLQWPCTGKDHPGTPILHVGRFTRGKGTYCLAEYKPAQELPDEEYPLLLATGRNLYHYNAMAMTDKTPGLMELAGHSYIELHVDDARALDVRSGERVRVTSRRGTICTEARVSRKTNPGECWMPMHYLDGGANWLTNAALDGIARAPEYKVCAVRVEKLSDAEAYDANGTYITQSMVAQARNDLYAQQLGIPGKCAAGEEPDAPASSDDCSKLCKA